MTHEQRLAKVKSLNELDGYFAQVVADGRDTPEVRQLITMRRAELTLQSRGKKTCR